MEFKLEDGYTVTEAELNALGDACDKGLYPGTPGDWVVKPQGRPKLSNEPLVTVAFKLPKSQLVALDEIAKNQGKSRSDFLRTAIATAIV